MPFRSLLLGLLPSLRQLSLAILPLLRELLPLLLLARELFLHLRAPPLLGHVARAHEPHTMLHPLPGTTLGRTYGVNQLVLDGERLLTAGATLCFVASVAYAACGEVSAEMLPWTIVFALVIQGAGGFIFSIRESEPLQTLALAPLLSLGLTKVLRWAQRLTR